MKKYLTAMLILGLGEIGLAAYLTHWREWFWNAVQSKNIEVFTHGIGIFTVVALLLCIIAAYASYCGALAAIKWRQSLNSKALYKYNARELAIDYGDVPVVENFNQRIQQDCMEYPQLFINIIYGLAKALVYIGVFAVMLIMQFKASYLLYITLYAVISTLVARKIAVPLIELNYTSQGAEATYRNKLSFPHFDRCIEIMLGLAKKTKRLNYFQVLYGQCAVIVPLLIIAPEYFSNPLMTLGLLISANSILSTLLDNMSFLINSFTDINRLLSCKKRLEEVEII